MARFESKAHADEADARLRLYSIILGIAALVVFGGGLALALFNQFGAGNSTGNIPTARLTSGSYSSVIECPGTVNANQAADIEIPGYAATQVKKGKHVKLDSPDVPGARYEGMIHEVSDASSSDERLGAEASRSAIVLFDYSDGLKPGMRVVAYISIDDYGEVYYAPASAVREIDGAHYVAIMRAKGTIEQHQVELLGTAEDGSKIIKGAALANETTVRADFAR